MTAKIRPNPAAIGRYRKIAASDHVPHFSKKPEYHVMCPEKEKRIEEKRNEEKRNECPFLMWKMATYH